MVFARALRRRRIAVASSLALLLWVLLASSDAHAVPSFAEQTGQPCAACHVGAFGPRLKQVGRDFKLYGYVASDGKPKYPPLAVAAQTSFTHTDAPQAGGAAPHFGPNDNFTLDQLSLFYAGRVTPEIGAFMQVTYDGVARRFAWDNNDIRHAGEAELFGQDLVWGLDANNNPTVEDIWNSTPAWSFPFAASVVAPTPAAATLIDGGLAHAVEGFGTYAMWNDLVYVEAAGYTGLSRDVRNALGVVPVSGTDSVDGFIPYWRLALQHEFANGRHYAEIGTYGLSADTFPGGIKSAGSDHLLDTAIDANYQFVVDPKTVVSDVVSAHATYIKEQLDLNASAPLLGTNPHDTLSTFRTDVSYSIGATWTPTVQYFQTTGSNDPARFGTASGSPNTSGVITELAYVPWGKPDSPTKRANARLTLQYVAYDRFDGATRHASDNNTIFLNLWVAFTYGP
jgi:hypothetical protein